MLSAWNELETIVIMESKTSSINIITNRSLYNEIGIKVSFENEFLGFTRY